MSGHDECTRPLARTAAPVPSTKAINAFALGLMGEPSKGLAGALFPPNDESGGRALVSTDFWSPVSVLSWALRDQRSPHDGSMGHCVRRCRRDSSSLVDAGPDGGCAAVREDVRRRAGKG